MLFDRLNEQEIARRVPELTVRVMGLVDSTNNEAKRYALSGGVAPAVFLAEGQSAGRGRMGRDFYSPEGTGIYLSLLLPMTGELSDAVLLTSAAAVGARRAIRSVTGIEVGIKWVNDLYYRQKKVCGILAESFFAEERRYVVLGVGINLYTEDFPEALREIAGGLNPAAGNLRNALASETTAQLYALAKDAVSFAWLEEYRRASIVLGRQVTYIENGVCRQGRAESMDDRGRLQIRHEDGSSAILASGEISLRVEKGEDT